MSDTTRLQLPLLAAAQAQKHVTHNEALMRLDGLVQMTAKSCTASAQPGSPTDGDLYLLPTGKTGTDWGGYSDHAVAHYYDGIWHQYQPGTGWLCFVQDTSNLYFYTGSSWSILPAAGMVDGNAVLPGLPFFADIDTGMFRPGANVLGLAAGGAEILRLSGAGLSTDGGTTSFKVTAGTFTPTLYSGNTSLPWTMTAQEGHYVKIGKLVYVNFYVAWSAKNATSGNPMIGPLPFAANVTTTRALNSFFVYVHNPAVTNLHHFSVYTAGFGSQYAFAYDAQDTTVGFGSFAASGALSGNGIYLNS